MFQEVSLQDWEKLVQKQLKSDDIYEILKKENLENLEVAPNYDSVKIPLKNLPKIEESTHLVSRYHKDLEDDVFAFLLEHNIEDIDDKALFINNVKLAEHIRTEDSDQYFSLIDVFDEAQKTIKTQLGKELLEKNFKRNICIDVALHQNAGASIIQQVGIALAKTKDLVEIFGKEIFKKLIFRIAIGGNYFFEISKIRALKLAFNQLSKEYDLDEIPYIFSETTQRNKTKTDPENNLIRSTLELAAAMIGGSDAVFSNDYQLQNPTELSEEISFKQQIVLAYESIVNVFDDAGNGSYYIENLTQQIAEKSWKYFLEIEETGGYFQNLETGKIQQNIYKQTIKEQSWIEEGKIKLIGINLFPKLEKIKSIEDLYQPTEIRKIRWSEMFE